MKVDLHRFVVILSVIVVFRRCDETVVGSRRVVHLFMGPFEGSGGILERVYMGHDKGKGSRSVDVVVYAGESGGLNYSTPNPVGDDQN